MNQPFNKDNYYWWKSNKSNVASDVFSYVKFLDRDQSYRTSDNYRNMRLYGNADLPAYKAYTYMRNEPSYSIQNRVTMNVVQSMIDTVVSKITKNKPRPMFLTSGGDWSLQRKAEKLTKFIEGQFYSTDFYTKSSFAFLDACIFGTGCLKIFSDGDKINVDRVFIDEIVVDDSESVYGQPRQMHQKKYVHRDVLKSLFPNKKGAIDIAGKGIDNNFFNTANTTADTDMILVIESWHLPSGPDAKDGRRTICIENECLLDEDWNQPHFPFVFFRWGLRPLGFFGQGISEQLTGIQLEINKILKTIQVSMHLVSVPKIFVEVGSKIVDAHLNNKIGGIIRYAGQPPTPGQLGVIPPELFSHLDRLYQRCYEIVGVSQLAATASKPAGLNSGKALRVYNDIETERFMSVATRYEQAFLEAARQFISLAKEIYETKGKLEVKVKGKKFMDTISWSDVDMDEDQYMMQMFPTSALSNTPAGRLQEVQELLQAGFVSREDAKKLLDFPDLEGFYNMENSGVEDINRQIELMIDSGKYEAPEPYQNLTYGKVKMQQAYLMYRAQNAPEERLDLFRRWIEDADRLEKKAQQEVMAMQQQAQIAAQPMGVPAPQPVSDLLPVAE